MKTKTAKVIASLTTLLVICLALTPTASAGPIEDVIDEVMNDECPFVQIYLRDPYVALHWECLDTTFGEA